MFALSCKAQVLQQCFFYCSLSGKDDVLDIEIDSYIHCISAFVKLAQSEYALLTEIIPEHHQKKTFDSLIQVRHTEISSSQCRFGNFQEEIKCSWLNQRTEIK